MIGDAVLALASAAMGGVLSGGGAYLAVRAQIKEGRRQSRRVAALDAASAVVAHGAALQGLTAVRGWMTAHPIKAWAVDATGWVGPTAAHTAGLLQAAKQIRYLGDEHLTSLARDLANLAVEVPDDPRDSAAWEGLSNRFAELVTELDEALDLYDS